MNAIFASLLHYRGQSDYGSLIFLCPNIKFSGSSGPDYWTSHPISGCQVTFSSGFKWAPHTHFCESNLTPAFSRTPSLDGFSIFLDDQFSGPDNSLFSPHPCLLWIIQVLSTVLPISWFSNFAEGENHLREVSMNSDLRSHSWRFWISRSRSGPGMCI